MNFSPKDEWSQKVFSFWRDRVPIEVAVRQTTWERGMLITILHEQFKITYKEMAAYFNMTPCRAAQLAHKFEVEDCSPAMMYFYITGLPHKTTPAANPPTTRPS